MIGKNVDLNAFRRRIEQLLQTITPSSQISSHKSSSSKIMIDENILKNFEEELDFQLVSFFKQPKQQSLLYEKHLEQKERFRREKILFEKNVLSKLELVDLLNLPLPLYTTIHDDDIQKHEIFIDSSFWLKCIKKKKKDLNQFKNELKHFINSLKEFNEMYDRWNDFYSKIISCGEQKNLEEICYPFFLKEMHHSLQKRGIYF